MRDALRALRCARWNCIWLVPILCLCTILTLFNGVSAIKQILAVVAIMRWKVLSLLISPSADIWMAALVFSFVAPVIPAAVLLTQFNPIADRDDWYKTVGYTVLGAIAVVLNWALIWGSLPLEFTGEEMWLRMIPFIPWPHRPFIQ